MTAAATKDDPILRTARARMLAAATHYGRAIREVKATMRMLKKHPDFKLTERRQKAGGSPRDPPSPDLARAQPCRTRSAGGARDEAMRG